MTMFWLWSALIHLYRTICISKHFLKCVYFFFRLMLWFNSPRVCSWTYLLFITIIKMILWLFIATLLAEVQIIRIIEKTGFWFIKTHLKGVFRWHKLRRASWRYVNRIVSYYIKYVRKKNPYYNIKFIWFTINWFTSYFQFKKKITSQFYPRKFFNTITRHHTLYTVRHRPFYTAFLSTWGVGIVVSCTVYEHKTRCHKIKYISTILPTLNIFEGVINFTILVEGFMDFIIIHFVLSPPVWG